MKSTQARRVCQGRAFQDVGENSFQTRGVWRCVSRVDVAFERGSGLEWDGQLTSRDLVLEGTYVVFC
jgi:hypothetical protein